MTKQKIFSTHNKLTIVGLKIHPTYAKAINNAMYDATQLDGAYQYDNTGFGTVLTIYPEDFDFGNDPSEIQKMMDVYRECYEYTISNYPECLI